MHLHRPQEDSEAGINLVQTSAQFITNQLVVDAEGQVQVATARAVAPPSERGVMSVTADGRMHTEI